MELESALWCRVTALPSLLRLSCIDLHSNVDSRYLHNVESPHVSEPRTRDSWTFLSNHATVLLHIASHPDDTVLQIGLACGLRERGTAQIIHDLREAGYLTTTRRGRQSHYSVNVDMPLRRPAHAGMTVKDLLVAMHVITDADR